MFWALHCFEKKKNATGCGKISKIYIKFIKSYIVKYLPFIQKKETKWRQKQRLLTPLMLLQLTPLVVLAPRTTNDEPELSFFWVSKLMQVCKKKRKWILGARWHYWRCRRQISHQSERKFWFWNWFSIK